MGNDSNSEEQQETFDARKSDDIEFLSPNTTHKNVSMETNNIKTPQGFHIDGIRYFRCSVHINYD